MLLSDIEITPALHQHPHDPPAPAPNTRCSLTGTEYHVDMIGIFPQCLGADYSDRSARSDVLLRREPDEEEDEEEDEGDRKEDEEDEDTDDGYSE